MKKLLVALSLGLVATSMSLQASPDVKNIASQAQDALLELQSKIEVQLCDLGSVESYLKKLSKDDRTKVEGIWNSLINPLSKSISKSLSDATKKVDIASVSNAMLKQVPLMLKDLAENAKPYKGPKPSLNFAQAKKSAKAYANYVAEITTESASNLASVSPILTAKLTQCITQFANGSSDKSGENTVVEAEVSVDAANEAISLD